MVLEVKNICKSFGDTPVFTDFSCEIPLGKISCIMGPSGRGKTTLLRMLMGLETPDSGELLGFAGLHAAAVFQEDRLCDNLSAQANVLMVCQEQKKRTDVRAALAALGLTDNDNQPVREFSGGMRRRVALARALMADCDILYLDEPFKGLDAETKELSLNYTKNSTQGKTVLLVTHDYAEAEALGTSPTLILL
jgi:NitT/TauT family transport system ATP-binding protein